ncbi:MAG: M23 family metallopeptidase [Thermodesulfobacteriota bacterium]
MFKSFKKFIFLLFLASIIAAVIIFFPYFELKPPQISFSRDISNLGLAPFNIIFTDKGKGLKKVEILLITEKGEIQIAQKSYEKGVKKDEITVKLNFNKIGFKNGHGELIVKAEDYSKSKVFSGNKTEVNAKVSLDLVPPTAAEISSTQYLNHGGSGFIVYKVSNDTVKSGVKIKDYFFKGYGRYFQNPDIRICFFAYPYDLGSDENIFLFAEDAAGNSAAQRVDYNLKNIVYRKSDIEVSENFIQSKMLPILINEGVSDSNLEVVFLKVNNELRKENNSKISELGKNTADKILWNGRFSQLSNSKVEASFADERTYLFNDKPLDNQYHLGFDLSVTKNYPVEAANRGIVVFAGDLGIYGNTVILDHGMGVMSLYAHLSSISVQENQELNKNDILGKTGVTGLAGGDHLHFAMYIQGVPVRPIEWWDQKWINEKILDRIEAAKSAS